MTKKIRIAIADDHVVIRIGLERVLSLMPDLAVVAQLAGSNDVLQANLHEVDILLLDLNMPGAGGLSLIPVLVEKYPDLKIVVFSMLPEESFAPRVRAAGAAAYVNKNQPPEELIAALRAVARSGGYLSRAQKDISWTLDAETDQPLHNSLSPREFEILMHLANGNKPTVVASKLGLKMGTVTTHVHRIKRKLGATSIGELVAYAHRHGLA